jgi:hypothetical protein
MRRRRKAALMQVNLRRSIDEVWQRNRARKSRRTDPDQRGPTWLAA